MPATWQTFHHAWPSLPAPSVAIDGDTLAPWSRISAWKPSSTQGVFDAIGAGSRQTAAVDRVTDDNWIC